MMKRAQGKSALGPMNWKPRFFVLQSDELSYWDEFGGATNPQGKKKGTIPVGKIRAVEELPDSAFNRQHMFQVVFGEVNSVLYMQSSDTTDRTEWITALRKLIPPANQNASYHLGVFDSKWSCCSDSNKASMGCQPCTPFSR